MKKKVLFRCVGSVYADYGCDTCLGGGRRRASGNSLGSVPH